MEDEEEIKTISSGGSRKKRKNYRKSGNGTTISYVYMGSNYCEGVGECLNFYFVQRIYACYRYRFYVHTYTIPTVEVVTYTKTKPAKSAFYSCK